MKVRLVKRGNPLRPQDDKKWYGNLVNTGVVNVDDFAGFLTRYSALTRGDIRNVLNAFTDEAPTFLRLGHSVQLGELGTLRLSASSEGATTPEEFNTSSIQVKLIFTPGKALKNGFRDITFEVEKRPEPEVNP